MKRRPAPKRDHVLPGQLSLFDAQEAAGGLEAQPPGPNRGHRGKEGTGNPD